MPGNPDAGNINDTGWSMTLTNEKVQEFQPQTTFFCIEQLPNFVTGTESGSGKAASKTTLYASPPLPLILCNCSSQATRQKGLRASVADARNLDRFSSNTGG